MYAKIFIFKPQQNAIGMKRSRHATAALPQPQRLAMMNMSSIPCLHEYDALYFCRCQYVNAKFAENLEHCRSSSASNADISYAQFVQQDGTGLAHTVGLHGVQVG